VSVWVRIRVRVSVRVRVRVRIRIRVRLIIRGSVLGTAHADDGPSDAPPRPRVIEYFDPAEP
jgi:hypothetical protein